MLCQFHRKGCHFFAWSHYLIYIGKSVWRLHCRLLISVFDHLAKRMRYIFGSMPKQRCVSIITANVNRTRVRYLESIVLLELPWLKINRACTLVRLRQTYSLRFKKPKYIQFNVRDFSGRYMCAIFGLLYLRDTSKSNYSSCIGIYYKTEPHAHNFVM